MATLFRRNFLARLAPFSFAFRFLATAAAFEALVAIALRCSAVSVLARASPPRSAIIDRYFETADLRMFQTIARSLPGTVEFFFTPKYREARQRWWVVSLRL